MSTSQSVRLLSLNQNLAGSGMLGHETAEDRMRQIGASDLRLRSLVTKLPPLGLAGRVAGRPLPWLWYLDLDLHPTRWHIVESLRARRTLKKLLTTFDANVVHVSTHTAALLCVRLMRQRPFMISVDVPIWPWHEMGIWRPVRSYSRASLWLSERLERRAFGNAALVLAYSEWAARLVQQECPSARVRIWHPGVDANRFSPASERPAGGSHIPYRLLFVGARFAAKGGEDLLEAVGHRLGRDIELDIVTPDPVASRPGLGVHRLEPGAPQLVDLYRSADLLCLPTRGDSFGWVVLEAMSCGVPVIASRMGAIPELLRPGTAEEAGIVVDARDPGALAQALDELLADPERRRSMGAAGRRAVLARHSSEVQMKRFLELVGEVLESAR